MAATPRMLPSADELLESALRSAIDDGGDGPPRLREALDRAVFPGGARVRPHLCLAVASSCRGLTQAAVGVAAAVELLHCASLVHDDLPCFDDAELRRGRPSIHRAYGEASAVLVGDALIVAAFGTAARALASSPRLAEGMSLLASAAGGQGGLVAGQAWELEPSGPPDVTTYHRAKTAALFEAAAGLGALAAGMPAVRFVPLGRAIGVAYQIADDLSDACGTEGTLGKPVHRDAALGRPTAVDVGVPMARARFEAASARAVATAETCGGGADLAAFVERALTSVAARFQA